MNFYQHHIGDFNGATRHLTRIERSIYRDLLELYYDSEKPLTSDFDRLARRCIVDEADRTAMRDVLNEFFILSDDGYHNTRADKEIAVYQGFISSGKRGAAIRWGKGDYAPPIAPPIAPPNQGLIATMNHEPITMNHEPITMNHEDSKESKTKSKTIVPAALLASLGVGDLIAADWITLRKAKKAAITETAIAGIQREAEKAGMSLEAALRTCCERGWSGFKAEWTISSTSPPKRGMPAPDNFAAKDYGTGVNPL